MFIKTWRTGDAARRAGAALAVAGASFAFATPQVALAGTTAPGPKGDRGTVKVHSAGTSPDDRRDEPQVCSFYLVGFDFSASERISWEIQSWQPGDRDRKVIAKSTLTMGSDGHGLTSKMRLDGGHYRLTWNAEGQRGKGKHKMFKVDCEAVQDRDQGGQGKENQPPGKGEADKPGKEQEESSEQGGGVQPPTGNGPAPAAPPAKAPAKEPADGGALPFTGRAVAAVTSTGMGLVLAGGLAMLLMRRKGIGPFADTAAATDSGSGTGADGKSDPPGGLFGPLVGPAASSSGPPTTPGMPTIGRPPSGPIPPPQTGT